MVPEIYQILKRSLIKATHWPIKSHSFFLKRGRQTKVDAVRLDMLIEIDLLSHKIDPLIAWLLFCFVTIGLVRELSNMLSSF
jgi:hypothetical protein